MPALLLGFLTWFLANAAARILIGAGLSIVSIAWIEDTLNDMLALAASHLHSAGDDMMMIIGLSGFWIALSNVGSAMLMRVAVMTAANVIGLSKK